MVATKTILIVLILASSLSLIPNFSYNGIKGAADPCQSVSCPPCKIIGGEEFCCEKKYHEETGTCVCINCPIECRIGSGKFKNKSCLPAEGTGEWDMGREIPIGEIIDRSSFLASKMLAEFGGMIKSGEIMAETADQLLTNLPSFSCRMNASDCYKYLYFSGWELIGGPAAQCASGPQPPNSKECRTEPCESCAVQGRDWEITFAPDPEYPGNTITCQYQRPAGNCWANCALFRCGGYRGLPGCCNQYFDPAISAYPDIESAQEDLKNDINGTNNTPEKFKRSYILGQLNFSRCELAKCWIPAEDYPDVLAGDKVGKHLFTCKTASDMDLFEDDQLVCSVLQITNEWDEIKALWASPKIWWDWPVVIFKTYVRIYTIPWRMIWGMIQEWFDVGKEEGCYPTNYYCGQM